MKPSLIKVGKTYVNRGKANTTRTVTRIEHGLPCGWHSSGDPPDDPVVEYVDKNGLKGSLYLRSFSSWAGHVQPDTKKWSDGMLEYLQLIKKVMETDDESEVPKLQARMREVYPLLRQDEAARINRSIWRPSNG